jgi:hypothetical protein
MNGRFLLDTNIAIALFAGEAEIPLRPLFLAGTPTLSLPCLQEKPMSLPVLP